jgi:hypothetical protein
MSWNQAYKAVEPYIVKIETPAGSGTGFFFTYNEGKVLISIATALHVVKDADDWRQPLKIRQVSSGKELYLEPHARAILPDYDRDTAVILLATKTVTDAGLTVPEIMLPLFPSNKYKPIGTALGWAGYPAIAPFTLCLFQGGVSAFNSDNDSYYIDGIAINGVSGGPVFEYTAGDKDGVVKPPNIVGIVSAYHYNRQGGGNLPGLLMAHDATHLNKIVEEQKSLDEAQKRAAAEQAQRTSAASPSAEGQPPRQEAVVQPQGPLEPETARPGAAQGPSEPENAESNRADRIPGPAEPPVKRKPRKRRARKA